MNSTVTLTGLSKDSTVIIITALVGAPPLREQVGRPSRSLDCKRQDEHHDLSSPIKRCVRTCQRDRAVLINVEMSTPAPRM